MSACNAGEDITPRGLRNGHPKEAAMADRICRAVLEDVHGVLIERNVEGAHPQRDTDAFVRAGLRFHAECWQRAIYRFLNFAPPIRFAGDEEGNDGSEQSEAVALTGIIDPQTLWETQERAFNEVPRTDGRSRPRHQRDFLKRVNLVTLQMYFPRLAEHVSPIVHRKLASEVWRQRRHSLRSYTLCEDMLTYNRWMLESKLAVHLVTGLDRHRLRLLIQQCGVPEDVQERLSRSFSAGGLGTNKLSRHFWELVLEHCGVPAHELIAIGNSVPIDSSCTEAGIAVLMLDRGGLLQRFYRPNGQQTWRGIRLLTLGDDIPPRAPFIGFAETPLDLQRWIVCLGLPRAPTPTQSVVVPSGSDVPAAGSAVEEGVLTDGPKPDGQPDADQPKGDRTTDEG